MISQTKKGHTMKVQLVAMKKAYLIEIGSLDAAKLYPPGPCPAKYFERNWA